MSLCPSAKYCGNVWAAKVAGPCSPEHSAALINLALLKLNQVLEIQIKHCECPPQSEEHVRMQAFAPFVHNFIKNSAMQSSLKLRIFFWYTSYTGWIFLSECTIDGSLVYSAWCWTRDLTAAGSVPGRHDKYWDG